MHTPRRSENTAALLFNNLSDNLCGHSGDVDSWCLRTKNEYQVSTSEHV